MDNELYFSVTCHGDRTGPSQFFSRRLSNQPPTLQQSTHETSKIRETQGWGEMESSGRGGESCQTET